MLKRIVEHNRGASHAQVAAIEARLGRALPGFLKAFYLEHDGLQVYHSADEGRHLLSLHVFGVALDNLVYTQLTDPTDRSDFEAMFDLVYGGGIPLLGEQEEFLGNYEVFYDDVLPKHVCHWKENALAIGCDWDGSVGDYYCVDLSSQEAVVYGLPKTRFMSHASVVEALQNVEPTGFETWLAHLDKG